MVQLSKVIAELKHRGVEPSSYHIEQRTQDQLWLTLDGEEMPAMTGAGVVRACAEATGRHDVLADCERRSRFMYTAPESLVKSVKPHLGGTASVQTYSSGSGSGSQGPDTRGRGRAGATAAGAAATAGAALAGAAFQEPSTPPAGGGAAAVPAAGSGNVRGGRQRPAAVRVPVTPGGWAVGGLTDLQGDPELLYLLQTQHGAGLVDLMGAELQNWEAQKLRLASASKQQEASLAVQRSSLQQMLHSGANPAAQQHVSALIQALESEAAVQLANLTAAEARAADRCRLVQQHIDADPSARRIMFTRAFRRPSVLRYLLVALGAMLLGAGLQLVSPQCLEGVRSFVARLSHQCFKWLAGLAAAVWRLVRATLGACTTLVLGVLLGVARLLLGVCTLWWWVARSTAGLMHRGLTACWRQPPAISQVQLTSLPPQQAGQVCLPAAANAAAIYTATAHMHTTLLAMRAYYQQQQLPGAQQPMACPRQGLLQPPAPPSVADLSALVVGVSRLVQMEFGALHGQGECLLRDQVLRLLCGLLGVEEGCGVIRSEHPMGGGRSDLLITDLRGASLLVVEYKQRHSGAASAHQQQDTAQLKRYLSDRRAGCDEGLLITFDKTLPNGLSATRLTRVTDRQAWARLYSDRPSNAPAFMAQPLHRLESDPLAVGVMMGLCQGFGVQVVQHAGRE